jgi:hypothetical protein
MHNFAILQYLYLPFKILYVKVTLKMKSTHVAGTIKKKKKSMFSITFVLLYSFLIFKQQIWRLVLFHLGICERKGFSLIPFPLCFEFTDVVIELIKDMPAWTGRHLLDGGENRRYFGLESQPLIRGQMRVCVLFIYFLKFEVHP